MPQPPPDKPYSPTSSETRPSSVSPSAAERGGAVGRLLSRPLFWVAIMVVLFGLPLGRSIMRRVNPPPPVLAPVPAFSMTDQLGHPFGSRELVGKVWVADFIFTSCQTMCPLLTQRMAEIGKRARHLGPGFHLVSFTVDPERDTPQRLNAYAAKHGADAHKWTFLTGSLASVQQAVVDGFKIGIDRQKRAPAPADAGTAHQATATATTTTARRADDFWEIVHGEHLVVVDRRLQIRGYFDSSPEGLDRLLDALGRVANEP